MPCFLRCWLALGLLGSCWFQDFVHVLGGDVQVLFIDTRGPHSPRLPACLYGAKCKRSSFSIGHETLKGVHFLEQCVKEFIMWRKKDVISIDIAPPVLVLTQHHRFVRES